MIEYFITLMFFILIYASYIDIKTREVSDILTNSLFLFAIMIRLIFWFVYQDISYIIEGINGLVFLIGGYLIYRLGQWGGGDAKLIGGMGLLFGTTFSLNDFMIQYVIALIFGGAIWGIGYSFYLIIKNKTKIKIKSELIIWLIFLVIYFYLNNIQFLIIFLIPIMYSLYPRLKEVEKLLIKKIKTKDLVEGDWLVEDIKIGNVIIKKQGTGLTIKNLEILKKKNIMVKVKDGIPFVPSFLVGLILIIIWKIIF